MTHIEKDIKILYNALNPLEYADKNSHYEFIAIVYLWGLEFPNGKSSINEMEEIEWFHKKFKLDAEDEYERIFIVYLKEYAAYILSFIRVRITIQKTIDEKKGFFSDPLIDVLHEVSDKLEKIENYIGKTSKGKENEMSHIDTIKEKRKRRQKKRKLLKKFRKGNFYKKVI